MRRFLFLMILMACALLVSGCDGQVEEPQGPPPGGGGGGAPPPVAYEVDPAGLSLPFPAGEVQNTWMLDEDRVLVEHVTNRDHSFYLYSRPAAKAELIVPFIHEARYEGRDREWLLFRAVGYGDTGCLNFPYRVAYDLATGETAEAPMYLPVTEPVVMGMTSWKQVLGKLELREDGLTLGFRPRAGEILAGGHRPPQTTVHYDEQRGELVFRFYEVENGLPRAGVTGDGAVSVQEVPAGEPPDMAPLLVKTYGSERADLADWPSVRVRVPVPPDTDYYITPGALETSADGDLFLLTVHFDSSCYT